MKKLLTLICLSFLGTGNVFTDESSSSGDEINTYGVKYNTDLGMNEIYKANADGSETLLLQFRFATNGWVPGNSFADSKTGKLYLWQSGSTKCTPFNDPASPDYTCEDLTEEEKGFYVYDPSTNTMTKGVKEGFNDGYQKTFQSVLKLDEIIKNDVDSEDGSSTTVIGSTDIVGSDGNSMISVESDGSVHIGEDSLVTVEENGVQQLYATNASDQMIDINIKKGTDLLIDGVSVSGSLNTNATNIATNTTDIATNKTDIATNTTDIATNTADIATNKTDIATNTADIATNKTDIATNTTDIATNKTNIATNVTNIAANTAEIATYTASISSNTTAIAALGSDLSAFKSSTNSQITYMKSDYSSGIASAVAMSQFNLAQEGFSVGIGRGSYNDEDETAFGLGYGGEFKNGTLFKLQASKSGDASGVGLTISF